MQPDSSRAAFDPEVPESSVLLREPDDVPPIGPPEPGPAAPGDAFRRAVPALLCFAVAAVVGKLLLLFTDLPREQVYMIGIFVVAAALWLTQAVPLFATSIVIILLMVIFLANPAGWEWMRFGTSVLESQPDLRTILGVLGSPILVLFFGGFVLAAALVKEGVDKSMAAVIVGPFGGKPKATLAAVMFATGP